MQFAAPSTTTMKAWAMALPHGVYRKGGVGGSMPCPECNQRSSQCYSPNTPANTASGQFQFSKGDGNLIFGAITAVACFFGTNAMLQHYPDVNGWIKIALILLMSYIGYKLGRVVKYIVTIGIILIIIAYIVHRIVS